MRHADARLIAGNFGVKPPALGGLGGSFRTALLLLALAPAPLWSQHQGGAVSQTGPAVPQRVARPSRDTFDAFRAGAEAHAWGEMERRWAVQQQAGLAEALRQRVPFHDGGTYFDQTIYFFGPMSPGRPNLGPSRFYSAPVEALNTRASLVGIGRSDATVFFEPWPYFVDLWGYPYQRPMRQPIGQRQTQTRPRRWESHPIYDRTVAPPADRRPTGPREF